jgi:hypothetical protein
MKMCAICEQPILPEQLPSIQLKNGDDAHLLCWRKTQDTTPTGASESARQLAWQELCVENGWSCRICGALPELGQNSKTTCAKTARSLSGTTTRPSPDELSLNPRAEGLTSALEGCRLLKTGESTQNPRLQGQ